MNTQSTLEDAAASGSDNPYHQHLGHCDECRSNPLGSCAEADRTVRQAVEEGSTNQFDRELDEIRNGKRDE